jgi:predicted house-cleaning noncanonical NTP pyrophosphatase (MazG superfamily)
VADEKEYQGYLANKICEESEELWASIVCPEGSTKKDILEEAADVLEVLYAIGLYHGFDQADLHRAMLQKRSKKGGFNKRIIMLTEKATPV